jgi:hypothetical protein
MNSTYQLSLDKVDIMQILDALNIRLQYWQHVQELSAGKNDSMVSDSVMDSFELADSVHIINHYMDIIAKVKTQLH